MPPIPQVPIDKPHVDKALGLVEGSDLAGSEEVERRVQEVLLAWLLTYFSGVSFVTPGEAGSRTFEACDVRFDEITPQTPQQKPFIHIVLADRNDADPIRINGAWEVSGLWRWVVEVRVNNQMAAGNLAQDAGESANKSAPRICRRVADQLTWLLRSPHTQSLSLKGVRRARVVTAPRLVPAGAYHSRLLAFSAEIKITLPRNDP